MIKLSIVIVCYKNAGCIDECLMSIRKWNDLGDKLEVIVVDNGPDSDPTGQIVQSGYPEVLYIRNAHNNGFGGGNNTGVRAASGEYLLLLNPDTILIEPVLSWAVDKFERSKGLSVFGVRLVDRSLQANQSFSYMPEAYGFFNTFFYQLNHIRNRCNLPPGKFFTLGADLFLRKTAFEQIGMFDEKIFLYFEEPDLFYRLEDAGYQKAYFPEKRIVHLEGQSTGDMPRQKYIHYYQSMHYVMEKHKRCHPKLAGKMALVRFVFRLKYWLKRSDKLRVFVSDITEIMEGNQ